MRWVLGTLLAIRPPRLHSPLLFGEGQPKLAQEEIKALAGLWRVELDFEDRYDADMSLYLEPSGRVIPFDDELPYNLGENAQAWAWWSADRAVIAGADGDDELSLSLQLGHLKLEGRGARVDFRCSEFAGEVLYEGTDDDPVGSFRMRLALPTKTNVTSLEERYRERIAARPPPLPALAFADFVGRWLMGLSEDEAPGSVFFPVELAADGTWWSERTMPKLEGTWGMCSGDPESHGAGPDTHPTGSHVWLMFGSEMGVSVYLQGKPVLKPGDQEPAAARASDHAGGADGVGDGATPPALADQVDGRMWEGSNVREYFGEFRLLRESALVRIVEAARKEAQAALQKAIRERAAAAEAAAVRQAEEEKAAAAVTPREERDEEAEEDVALAGATPQVEEEEARVGVAPAAARKLSEEEAKRVWLAQRGLDRPLWGHGRARHG